MENLPVLANKARAVPDRVKQSDGIFLLLKYIGFLQPSDLHPGLNNTQHSEALNLLSEDQLLDGLRILVTNNAVCLPSALSELRSRRLLFSDSTLLVEGLPATPQNLETTAESSSSASSASFNTSYELPPSLGGTIPWSAPSSSGSTPPSC